MSFIGVDVAASMGDAAGAGFPHECVFSTKCAYTASPFWEYANERARAHPVLSWIAAEVEKSRATTSLRSFSVPADKELSDYQKADLAYMLDRPGRVLDADEPGLGKTMTAIAYCNEVRAKKVLIVVPAHLRYQRNPPRLTA